MECEKCPVANYCAAYKQARQHNKFSYHPQDVTRAEYYECPLLDIVRNPRKIEQEEQ